MKSLAKYLVLAGMIAFIPSFANAEISVKDTTSPEFIHNAGYSPEISRIIDVKTKDPATPIPADETTKLQKAKWYFWKFIDPSVDAPGTYVNHETKFHTTPTDL